MLKVRDLEVFYGPIRAVRGIDLDIEAGEIIALIGANGAGKTTTVRAIADFASYKGATSYDGKTLTPNSAELNLRAGLAMVPEGRGILGRVTVKTISTWAPTAARITPRRQETSRKCSSASRS